MRKVIIYLVIFFITLGLFAVFVLFLKSTNDNQNNISTNKNIFTIENASSGGVENTPVGYKKYQNDHYDFQLFYPEDLVVESTSNGEKTDSVTILFTNKEKNIGFQIFIVPYLSPYVTRERFLADLPSGVMENPEHTSVGGVAGQKFFSQSKHLGETAEVWFQKGDYLYEVSTFKENADWLNELLKGWKFIDQNTGNPQLPLMQ